MTWIRGKISKLEISQNIYVIKYYNSLLKNQNSIYVSGMGKSMSPLLNEKMKIRIIRKEKYALGDLVLYSKLNKLILHRIIEINGAAYRVKGDNTLSNDVIRTKQIIGCASGYTINGKNDVVFLINRISKHTIPSILRKIDESNLAEKIITTKMLRSLLIGIIIMYRIASICYSFFNRKTIKEKN